MPTNVVLRYFGIGQNRSSTEHSRRRGRRARSTATGPFALPLYDRLASGRISLRRETNSNSLDLTKANTTDITAAFDDNMFDGTERNLSPNGRLLLHQHGSKQKGNEASVKKKGHSASITLSAFLANFTLGFADGLTVPFALTAGLSWLGSSHMVITAGSAEICAGCISMGIGGYLAAKGERNAAERKLVAAMAAVTAAGTEAQSERVSRLSSIIRPTSLDEEAGGDCRATRHGYDDDEREDDVLLARYLAPLGLPVHLAEVVMAHVSANGRAPCQSIIATAVQLAGFASGLENGDEHGDEATEASPVVAGLSVALGYLLGGLLPLFPYFFVHEVTEGLVWSFFVCLVALFLFGFLKEFVICVEQIPQLLDEGDYDGYYQESWGGRLGGSAGGRSWAKQWLGRAWVVSSEDIKTSLWEGVIMAGLGGIAAVAAVVCVILSQVVVKEEPRPEQGSS